MALAPPWMLEAVRIFGPALHVKNPRAATIRIALWKRPKKQGVCFGSLAYVPANIFGSFEKSEAGKYGEVGMYIFNIDFRHRKSRPAGPAGVFGPASAAGHGSRKR